jgi:two-component system, NarL family, nitrate/nitrite response regulator NarL
MSEPLIGFSSRKTLLACETQPITAEGLRALLADSLDLEYQGSAESLLSAADLVRLTKPALVLLDKGFGSQAVLQWIAEMKHELANSALIVWGGNITEPEALRFLQAGVRGIMRKTASPEMLLHCLRSVAQGSNWMEDSLFREYARPDRYPRSDLTPREQQVLELVEQGLKNKEIARELGIRPGTVKIHLKHIFEKTGVRGRYGLALSGLKEKGALEMADTPN